VLLELALDLDQERAETAGAGQVLSLKEQV